MRFGIGGFALITLCLSQAMADDAIWIGPATGLWNAPANWSTGVVPTFNTAGRIDDNPAQNTRVESRTNANISLLMIDPGDTLAVLSSTFSGFAVVDGTVSVGATLNASVQVNPGGELRLDAANAIASLNFLNNQGEVHGGGRLTLGTTPSPPPTSYNNSIIRADNPTIPLTFQVPTNANFENNGRLIATGGGKLQLQQGFISATTSAIRGGRIEAHPGSTVVVGTPASSVSVEDAVLAMVDDNDPLTAAPVFQFAAKLTDVTLEGNFKITGADFVGTLTNKGQMSTGTFSSSPNWHNDIIGEVLLTGGGTVQLGDSPQALFGSAGPTGSQPNGNRLINVDNVIRGNGSELLVSWAGFTNRHIVQADSTPAGEMVFYNGLSPDGFVNSGVMKAINGGRLRLGYQGGSTQGTMQNFEGGDLGEVIAGENSTVALANIRIKGGVLRTEGLNTATPGKFAADGLVVLEDVTLEGNYRFLTSAAAIGTITLEKKNLNKGSLTGRFAIATAAELAGGGEIVGEGGSLFSFMVGAKFVNADNLIHGSGNITTGTSSNPNARFTNRGTIRADGSQGPLTFSGQLDLVNRGRMEAIGNGTLSLPTQTTVINSEDGFPGTIHAGGTSTVTLARVDGGILSTEGSGVIRPSALIKDVQNLGRLEVNQTVAQGTIVNDGIINGALRFDSPFVRFNGTGQWQAPGTVFAGAVTNGPQHTILGKGDVATTSTAFAPFVNEGTIRTSDLSFGMTVGTFDNSGLVHAPAGRSLFIKSYLARATNTGTMQVDGSMEVSSTSGLFNDSGGVIDVRGTLLLKETRLRNRGGKITGNGQIVGPMTTGALVLNDGIIDPGPALATLTIGDDFQQLAGGQLKMQVSGGATPSSDLLQVNGSASLAGALNVTQLGDAAFAAGDAFTLLAATAGVSGEFQQLSLPTLTDELFWHVQYAANQVRALVAAVIPGDFTKDGSVGAEDYVLWRTNGGTQEQYDAWAAHFGQTVNFDEPPAPSQVPEPVSAVMLIACGVLVSAMRRRTLPLPLPV